VPGARLVDHFERRVWIALDDTPVEIDLTRIVEVTDGEPDAILAAAVRRLCAALRREADAGAQLPWETVRGLIFPRLVGPAFIEALPAEQGDVFLRRLGREVWETFVLKTRERARYVRRAEVTDWSKDGAAPRAQALQNLARASERARFLQHDTAHGPLVIAQSRDGLDAARLLLPGLHELLAPGWVHASWPRFRTATRCSPRRWSRRLYGRSCSGASPQPRAAHPTRSAAA